MAFLYAGRCTSTARLDGKTAVITGCNTGIGQINVKDFFLRGCRVIMACRDVKKAEEAAQEIKLQTEEKQNTGELVIRELNLASLSSVKKFSSELLKEEKQINILVNNAGIMMCPKTETEDGFELQFGTNHLGHFLLTLLLLPKIIQSAPARIINVSSVAHKHGVNRFDDVNWAKTPYNALMAYSQSKLANIHFTTELSRRLEGKNVAVYAVHPGVVRTELGRHLDSIYFRGFRRMMGILVGAFMKSPEQGAQTQIYCSVDEKAGQESGLYYVDCKPTQPYSVATSQEAAFELWELSWKLVGYKEDPFVK